MNPTPADPSLVDPAAAEGGGAAMAINEFLHTPARLNICSLLAPAEWVTFIFLRDSIGTTDSALSKQLTALEAAGYVEVRKERAVRRQTVVRLSDEGRTKFEDYLNSLEQLVQRARRGVEPSHTSR